MIQAVVANFGNFRKKCQSKGRRRRMLELSQQLTPSSRATSMCLFNVVLHWQQEALC